MKAKQQLIVDLINEAKHISKPNKYKSFSQLPASIQGILMGYTERLREIVVELETLVESERH